MPTDDRNSEAAEHYIRKCQEILTSHFASIRSGRVWFGSRDPADIEAEFADKLEDAAEAFGVALREMIQWLLSNPDLKPIHQRKPRRSDQRRAKLSQGHPPSNPHGEAEE